MEASTPKPKPDEQVKHRLVDAIMAHDDAYPFVLEIVGIALRAGQYAENIGGSEPVTLGHLERACVNVLAEQDPLSRAVLLGL